MFIKSLALTMSALLSLNLIDFVTGDYNNMAENPIILDMDFCTDVDDAVAVRMATTLDDMDVCTLMAVGVCTTPSDGSTKNLSAVNGLLVHDGYANVPIGKAHIEEPDTSPYWDVCAGYARNDFETKDAVELYKEVLDSCYNKVTIVTTGYLTNIQYLLQDTEGYNLVMNKCERIVITGGTFPSGRDNNFSCVANAAKAAKYVEENCPVQIVYVPNDVGGKYKAGGLIQDLSPEDVLSKALSAFGTQDGRAAWDPTAVFIAAVPEEVSNFEYVPITAKFEADGSHTFTQVAGAVYQQNPTVGNQYTTTTTDNTNAGVVVSNTDTVSGNNLAVDDSVENYYEREIKTVSPADMFEYRVNDDQSETTKEKYVNTPSIDSTTSVQNSKRLAVRYKQGISAQQYEDMIEGIISYEYLK